MKVRILLFIYIILLFGFSQNFESLLQAFPHLLQKQTIYDEGVKILQDYLRIDTTNPPGNEMNSAKFLKEILDKEGIENKIFDLGNNRANIFAILRGNGSKKAIILLHHMDVVPAEAKYWKVPPFSGSIINGEIYGRGAIDIKGKGIIDLMTMINIKRMKLPLKRDIIFLAVSDEEENSLGTKWMIKNKPELLKNAEFLIDEGESIRIDKNGNVLYYFVSIGEKSPLWLTLTFTGPPGHGSIPVANSSVNQAIKAANRILNYEMEFMLLPALKDEIKMYLGKRDITKIKGYTGNFETSLKNKTFLKEISKDPQINATLRNTISITCLKGSDKINTIPNEASLGLDCRLLPGVSKDEFIEKLKKVVGNDRVKIKINEFSNCSYSSFDTDFIRALKICANKRNKGVKVIPTILLSSTDSSYYRTLGIKAYGFEPYKLTEEEEELSHSNNERISIENIRYGIDLLTDILKELNK